MTMSPHGGGALVDLRAPNSERDALLEKAGGLTSLPLSARAITDLELLAIGGYTPLRGFLTGAECKSVVDEMHLPGGVPWTIPVTLSSDSDFADGLADGEEIALTDGQGRVLAIQQVQDRYTVDRREEARKIIAASRRHSCAICPETG